MILVRTLAVVVVMSSISISTSCVEQKDPAPKKGPVWSPGVTYRTEGAVARGLVDLRGLIHAHSVYSHDACDGEPVLADGSRDPVCFDDFRRGLCQSKHDFVFLTDHGDSFSDTEFPEALLYRPALGDVLVERGGAPTANRITCDDGETLVMAGTETGLMPVGLEGHAAPLQERGALYGALTAEAADVLRDHGAVVLQPHPEAFTVDELQALPLDGFEMYNLHANSVLAAGTVLDLLVRVGNGETDIAVPDLFMLQIWSEDERYLQRWGRILARGERIVSTMGTDCHRNTFTTILEDGERADSYRRMMIAFSNHLLVRPNADGTVDDANLKDALRAGRNYGVFEVMGYPLGFDAHGTKDGATYEIGEAMPVGTTWTVTRPRIRDLDPDRTPPTMRIRVLKAVDESRGFDVVAESADETLSVPLDAPGAYRAEVRIMPEHLREDLRGDAPVVLDTAVFEDRDYVWIYTSAFYVE